MNKKPILLLIEGAIGSGKSSLAYNLRENMKNTTMLSLSSIANDTELDSYLYHANILNMLFDMKDLGSNFILCRSFLSNEVYYRLGKKYYNNTKNYNFMVDKLQLLQYYYDVKIILLASNKYEYERRLGKREKFELIEHTVSEALAQQREYFYIIEELKEKGIEVKVYNNSGLSKKDLCKLVMVENGLE